MVMAIAINNMIYQLFRWRLIAMLGAVVGLLGLYPSYGTIPCLIICIVANILLLRRSKTDPVLEYYSFICRWVAIIMLIFIVFALVYPRQPQ